MKKIIYCIALLSGAANFSVAQNHSSGQHSKAPQHKAGNIHKDSSHHHQGTHGDMAEKRANMLTKELSLSPDQTTKVKALFAQQEKDIEAGWKNRTPADTASAHKNMKALYEKNQQELRAILTQAQAAKLDTIQAARKEKFMYNREHYMKGHGPGDHGHGGHAPHGQKK